MIRACLLTLLLTVTAFTQVRLETEISPDTITVGDHVKLTVTAEVPGGQVVNFLELPADSGSYQIIDKQLTENSVTYVITFWETGKTVIPGIPVQVLEDGKLITTLSTDPLPVEIMSVLDPSAKDIREIKGMQDVHLTKGWIQLLYGVSALLSFLIALLLWRRRVRVMKKAEKWVAPPDPPHVLAKNRLEALSSPYPLTSETAEKYYLELSGIFRKYLEDEFFIKSLEMTTTELMNYLDVMKLDPDVKQRTIQLLEKSDLSKFARHVPAPEQFENDKVLTADLIDAYHAMAQV
ncbi:MAG: protein BatD [FCB group bacterium]|nr:protein BatD [FCB group bacterium]